MMPAPGGPEPIGGVAFSPADASPSRARLGRVAAMLREAEEVAPVVPRRARRDQAAAAVVSLVGWRPGPPLPSPRAAADDVLTALAVAGPRT
jgi:hypothetical protein